MAKLLNNIYLRFLTKRLFGMVFVLLAVTVVSFAIFYAFPSDPARIACGKPCTPANLERAHVFMGLDVPIWQQFLDFIQGIFVGRTFGSGATAIICAAPCLGYSFSLNHSVTELIATRVPVTFSIAIGAAILWLIIGVAGGVIAALKSGKWPDKLVMGSAMFGLSAPSYLVGLIGIYIFGFVLKWLPTGGYVPFFENPFEWFRHLLLPWLILALLSSAAYSRITKSEMLSSINADYFTTARAKGLTYNAAILKHSVRNTSIPIITMFGMGLGGLLSGAVITETVFSMNGLGSLLISQAAVSDLPTVLGMTIFSAFLLIVSNFVVDIVYTFLDPRIELAG